MSATTAAPAPGGIFSISGRQWLILLMVQLSNLLFGMTITIANVVLPQVRGSLSATQDEIAWVITLNLVATAIATPMTGWLSARLGWRTMMLSAVGGFTVFSFMCGMANSLPALVIYRVGQGLCGAPIQPMGQAILLATFPKHLQPAALVMWGVGAVFGPVLGPVLGSMVSEAYDDWRQAFFMIVPPGLAALTCVWFALSAYTERRRIHFDWTGFLAHGGGGVLISGDFSEWGVGHRCYVSTALQNGYIVQVAAARDYRSFAAFKDAVRALPVSFALAPRPEATFTGLDGSVLHARYGDNPTVNGTPVDYAHWPLFDSPFGHAQPGERRLTLHHGAESYLFDFNLNRSEHSPAVSP